MNIKNNKRRVLVKSKNLIKKFLLNNCLNFFKNQYNRKKLKSERKLIN